MGMRDGRDFVAGQDVVEWCYRGLGRRRVGLGATSSTVSLTTGVLVDRLRGSQNTKRPRIMRTRS